MELKMYVFGEESGVVTWIVAKSKDQAVKIFEGMTGVEIEDLENEVREAGPDEEMTYYHDGKTPKKNTMANLIKKYCDEPDIFATSEF